jgi:galactokinase
MPRFDPEFLLNHLLTSGYPAASARSRAAVVMQAASALENLQPNSDNPLAFLVPGRIEFLGKHTDYAGGRSLLCAVDRGFAAVAVPRNDPTVRVIDALDGATISFDLDPQLLVQGKHWSNYAMTVARRIARNFPGGLRGADIALASDLPPSAGMSSSSALMIAIYLVLAKVNAIEQRPEYRQAIHSTEDLAGYLGTIENGQSFGALAGDKGVGTFGGSQDHTAILCSRPGMLRQYSFCPVRLEHDIALPRDYTLAVATSGVVAEKTGAAQQAYNAVSLSVSAIMHHWRQETGRQDATLADVLRSDAGAPDRLRKMLQTRDTDGMTSAGLIDRLEQFAAESEQIIPAAAAAMGNGRMEELGILIGRSQELSERLLRNQIPETIFLAKAARDCGAAAASAFGAGFGGSVWALIRSADSGRFLADWRERYARKFPSAAQHATFFVTSPGPAAQQLPCG